ncbi:MAG: ribose-phosphate pyrophosphokinase-like domain-containing protein, partial [Candidatus Paceibacterales bacterium]
MRMMGRNILGVGVAIILICSNTFAFDKKILLFGLRQAAADAKYFCQNTPNCQLIDEKTEEFSNGDTFVRVKTELAGQRVGILIPSKMSAQTLMETLIKIRTAKTLGAREIMAYCDLRLPQVEVSSESGILSLPLESFLKVAGVESVVEKGRKSRPTAREMLTAPKTNLTHSIIINDNHDSVAKDISAALSVPVFESDMLLPTAFKNAQVSFVRPTVVPKSQTFFEALSKIRKMTKYGAAVTWVTPLPWARSDKADQKGVTVIGRLVADLIESVGTEAIVFARAHAPQSQGFFNIPSFNVLGLNTLGEYLKSQGVEMVVSPDTGFQKDATLYA